MTKYEQYVDLLRKNRERIAEIEDHIDKASILFSEISKNNYFRYRHSAKQYSPDSFVGVTGTDLSIIESVAKHLLDKVSHWDGLRYKMAEDYTFCAQEPAFIHGLHTVCDLGGVNKNWASLPNNGECWTGEALRRIESEACVAEDIGRDECRCEECMEALMDEADYLRKAAKEG